MSSATKFRAISYLVPSIPVEYYEAILEYLERKLGLYANLFYESRWFGPPKDRPDPFTENDVDMAFMSSVVYLRMLQSGNKYIELLPVSSVHQHPAAEDRPGVYADVVVHNDLYTKKLETFDQLRGCKWAYTSPESHSGHLVTLQELKRRGEKATFFGHVLYSGKHSESIRMILNKQADAAAVDANCLALYLDRNPESREFLKVIESWGPLTPYPIVINKRLPQNLKDQIVSCLLEMHTDVEGAKKLSEFRVRRFAPVSEEEFRELDEVIGATKRLSFDTVYY